MRRLASSNQTLRLASSNQTLRLASSNQTLRLATVTCTTSARDTLNRQARGGGSPASARLVLAGPKRGLTE